MADQFIRDLVAASSLALTDYLVVDQGADAKKATVQQIKDSVGAGVTPLADSDITGATSTIGPISGAQAKRAAQKWGRMTYGSLSDFFRTDENGNVWETYEWKSTYSFYASDGRYTQFQKVVSGTGSDPAVQTGTTTGIYYSTPGTTATGYCGVWYGTFNSGNWGPFRTTYGNRFRAWAVFGAAVGSGNPNVTNDWKLEIGGGYNSSCSVALVFDINGFHIEHTASGTVTSSASYAFTFPTSYTMSLAALTTVLLDSVIGGTTTLYVNGVARCTLSTGWFSTGAASNTGVLQYKMTKLAGTTAPNLEVKGVGFAVSS